MFRAKSQLPEALRKKLDEHNKLVKHISETLEKHKGQPLPPNVGEDLDAKADEAEKLWAEIEPELKRYERLLDIEDQARQISRVAGAMPDAALPQDEPGDGRKAQRRDQVAGYLTVGEAFASSPEFKRFLEEGAPRQNWLILAADRLEGGRRGGVLLMPLTKEQREQWEQKAAPVIGVGVIEPDRLADIVRVTEHDELRLRDVLNVAPTTSDAVTYTRLLSYTRAAAAVAKGAQKPEAAMELDQVTVPVKTHAVWIPVNNNDLADLPRLANLIDTELLFDLDKYQEEQVLYGDGTGENFTGILDPASGVQAARTNAGDTLLDIIRRGITDVRRAGYQPNAVVIDPIDWEDIELLKGSDNRYVWAVIRDTLGPRVWSIAVVETVSAQANRGDTTEERNVIVGDWTRGATLWVRQAAAVSMGWINDQFIRNQRTVLAEQRAAFGVRRPNAFRKHQTQAPVP
ncbi:MAG TPA: phage major capsid protein [Longimicrobiales bacterium]